MKESAAKLFVPFESKMRQAGIGDAAIRAFRAQFTRFAEGVAVMIPEETIEPVHDLPHLEGLRREDRQKQDRREHLARTALLKLNGGLGTSMGLDRAKSLLPVKGKDSFLDFIARQILHVRREYDANVRFYLMNSFSTSRDTLEYLRKYPALGSGDDLELMQNMVPKIEANALQPVQWPKNRQMEWCPPGHGDIYVCIAASGLLDRLLEEEFRYLFVSNSDNLGAVLDLDLLEYFAASDLSFLMEVADRTATDSKGGHLARRKADGRLVLRESTQCPREEFDSFQDIERHRFFNTNNLWVRLDRLKENMAQNKGLFPLPLIRNRKPVDPRDEHSPAVIQLETAMGAAIECFARTGAIVVPRSRFAPVKTTSDLLVVQSDAYEVDDHVRLSLAAPCKGVAPLVELDPAYYRRVDQLDAMTRQGPPSLKRCKRLRVEGPVEFSPSVSFEGEVRVSNGSGKTRMLPAGTYRGEVKLP